MNVLIVGCGLTGARLANELDDRGYKVSVVDIDSRSFSGLAAGFRGKTVCGDATDIDVLSNVGASKVSVAVVVTDKDNINVMVAQILKVEFSVGEVYVRVGDPSREMVFRRFGLRTVCPTRIEADLYFDLITDDSQQINTINIGTNSIQLLSQKAEKWMFSNLLSDLPARKNSLPFALKRRSTGQVMLATDPDAVIEQGDTIIYAVLWGG